jgi:hypothetical protein
VVWWSNFILSPRKTGGGFQRGSARHVAVASIRDRHVKPTVDRYRGATRHVVAVYQGTLPFLRLSVGKFLPSPIQSVPVPSTRFFFPFRLTVFVTAHTLTHIRPGPSGVTGFMGSLSDEAELGLLRDHWIIGPPFVDRKSLSTMSNTGDVGG